MVGTVEADVVGKAVDEVEAVMSKKRKDRVEALLQVLMRVEEPFEIRRVGSGTRVAA